MQESSDKLDEEMLALENKMNDMSGLYKDEIRMRQLIYDQLTPIIAIAKENMLTNCMKNQEIMYTRDDLKDVHEKIRRYEELLKVIPEFETKVKKIEERVFKETQKLR